MRNAAETRERLLETATRLIWDSSYHQVGVNEICKQAGVTKGAFYHHFDSKADLFYTAGHHYWDSVKAELMAVFSPDNSPLEQLHLYMDLILDRRECRLVSDELEVSGCPFFTAGGQAGPKEEKVRLCAQELSTESIKYLSAMVRGLKGDGLLNGDPDISQLARLIFQYVHGLLFFGRVFASDGVLKADMSEALYRILDLKQEYRRRATDPETQL